MFRWASDAIFVLFREHGAVAQQAENQGRIDAAVSNRAVAQGANSLNL
jgi:ABC-type amino acid transport substrate-binding protein